MLVLVLTAKFAKQLRDIESCNMRADINPLDVASSANQREHICKFKQSRAIDTKRWSENYDRGPVKRGSVILAKVGAIMVVACVCAIDTTFDLYTPVGGRLNVIVFAVGWHDAAANRKRYQVLRIPLGVPHGMVAQQFALQRSD